MENAKKLCLRVEKNEFSTSIKNIEKIELKKRIALNI